MNVFEDHEFTPRSRCSIAAAVLGAGALSAGAGIFGASKAADAQTKAAQLASQTQLSMFNTAKGLAQPFVDAGSNALSSLTRYIDPSNPDNLLTKLSSGSGSPLAALLKLVTPGPDQTATLEQTPGFQFASQYGQKSATNALAARGLAGPGGALGRGIADYTTGLAGTQFGNIVNALISALGTGTNMFTAGATPLQNLVATGANSATGVGTNAVTTGGQVGSNIIGAGNAAAGAATSIANNVGNLGNSAATAAILQKLMPGAGSNTGTSLYDPVANAPTYPNPQGGSWYLTD